jgi:hypothetical protein
MDTKLRATTTSPVTGRKRYIASVFIAMRVVTDDMPSKAQVGAAPCRDSSSAGTTDLTSPVTQLVACCTAVVRQVLALKGETMPEARIKDLSGRLAGDVGHEITSRMVQTPHAGRKSVT